MKKMFLVVNKDKIYAYIVSVLTIVTIFFLSSLINSDLKDTKLTSSNIVENNTIGDAVSTSIPFDANSVENKNSVKEVINTENTIIEENISE